MQYLHLKMRYLADRWAAPVTGYGRLSFPFLYRNWSHLSRSNRAV